MHAKIDRLILVKPANRRLQFYLPNVHYPHCILFIPYDMLQRGKDCCYSLF